MYHDAIKKEILNFLFIITFCLSAYAIYSYISLGHVNMSVKYVGLFILICTYMFVRPGRVLRYYLFKK